MHNQTNNQIITSILHVITNTIEKSEIGLGVIINMDFQK